MDSSSEGTANAITLAAELQAWITELSCGSIMDDPKRACLLLDSYDTYYSEPGFDNVLEMNAADARVAWAELKELMKNKIVHLRGVYDSWRNSLVLGSELEWFDLQYGTFYLGKVVAMPSSDSSIGKVRFVGFKKPGPVDFRSDRILPAYATVAMVKPKSKPKPNERKPVLNATGEEERPHLPGYDSAEPTVVVSVSRTGRAVKTSISKLQAMPPKKTKKSDATKKRKKVDLDEVVGDIGDEPDHNDWICTVCTNFEAPDKSDLMLCDGGCYRSFHLGCLGMSASQIGKGRWLCEECRVGAHACLVCGETGSDGDVLSGVIKCSVAYCGKSCHVRCLQASGLEYSLVEKGGQTTIRCPRHYCDTCNAFYAGGGGCSSSSKKSVKANRKIFPCFKCPRAFHDNCCPPGTRSNGHCLLCDRHEDALLPNPDAIVSDAPQSRLDTVWDQMMLCLPSSTPSVDFMADPGHYRLPVGIKAEVDAKPPDYTPLSSLDYSTLPGGLSSVPALPSQNCCDCKVACGEDCLNYILKIECHGKKGEKNSVCKAGEGCGNRTFQNKKYVKIQPIQEPGMGWGCRVQEDVKRGTLVIEYIGEVIDAAEMQRRNSEQREMTPWDHEFYIMELGSGLFVDGKRKGSMSRFINHSCQPNCELVRWQVKGRDRIGIFAKTDIAKGASLSYDYHFDTNDADYFYCLCGSDNCRGTMAPEDKRAKVIEDVSQLTKEQKKKLIAAGRERTEREKGARVRDELSRSYTSRFLPGANRVCEMKNGPLRKDFQSARDGLVFLPRNTVRGSDFVRRREAYFRKAAIYASSVMGSTICTLAKKVGTSKKTQRR